MVGSRSSKMLSKSYWISSYIYLGKEYRAEVTCENGMCRPKNPNIPEACNYICGKGNCDHISKYKPFKNCLMLLATYSVNLFGLSIITCIYL